MILLVTDYDNTYELHYEGLDLNKIFNNNYNSVDDFVKSKNKFVIASGRHFDAMKQTIDEKKIYFDYLITNNGAELYDKDYKLLYALPIDSVSLHTLQSLETKLNILFRHPYKSDLITSANIYFEKRHIFEKIKKYLQKNLYNCIIEYKFPKIKIINDKCDKVIPIKIIQQIEKIESEKVYTIGDDINDIEMIKLYNGYSLYTANPIVKIIAKKSYESLSSFIENELNK